MRAARVVTVAQGDGADGQRGGFRRHQAAQAGRQVRLRQQRIVFRGRDPLQVGRLASALARHDGIGGHVAQALRVAAEDRGQPAHQVEQREHIHQAQQIAQRDLRELQAQSVDVDDAQSEEALADGLAAPAPLQQDGVATEMTK